MVPAKGFTVGRPVFLSRDHRKELTTIHFTKKNGFLDLAHYSREGEGGIFHLMTIPEGCPNHLAEFCLTQSTPKNKHNTGKCTHSPGFSSPPFVEVWGDTPLYHLDEFHRNRTGGLKGEAALTNDTPLSTHV